MADEQTGRMFKFLRNGNADPEALDWSKGTDTARQAISEAMNAKNIAFMLGAGCSSLMKGGVELGISTMAPLAKEFCSETLAARAAGFYADPPAETAPAEAEAGDGVVAEADDVWSNDDEDVDLLGAPPEPEAAAAADPEPAPEPAPWRLTKAELEYLDALGIDLEQGYNGNLERLMEVLFAQRFVLRQSVNANLWPARDLIDGVIKKVQDFLWARVTEGAFAKGDTQVRDLYERFYKKLVLRDRSLPRPWVFTTNYDHFNEMAMDRLGIPYANGFSGVVERRFNPGQFPLRPRRATRRREPQMDGRRRLRLPVQAAWFGDLDRGRSRPVSDQGDLAADRGQADDDLSDAGEAELLPRVALRRPVPRVPIPDRP